jgi:hypothetical protein
LSALHESYESRGPWRHNSANIQCFEAYMPYIQNQNTKLIFFSLKVAIENETQTKDVVKCKKKNDSKTSKNSFYANKTIKYQENIIYLYIIT